MSTITELVADIVSSHAANTAMSGEELLVEIQKVHREGGVQKERSHLHDLREGQNENSDPSHQAGPWYETWRVPQAIRYPERSGPLSQEFQRSKTTICFRKRIGRQPGKGACSESRQDCRIQGPKERSRQGTGQTRRKTDAEGENGCKGTGKGPC